MSEQDKLKELMELGAGGSMTPALRAQLDKLAMDVLTLDERIEKGEALLKQLKADRRKIVMQVLPPVLQSVGLKSYETVDDLEVSVKTIVSGSLPKEELARKIAIETVKEAGGDGLFTAEVSIGFGKGDFDKANQVIEAIGKLGFNHAVLEEKVHPQTLCAFVREKMAAGEKIDVEKIGVFVAPEADVKRKKTKRGKK